MHLTFVQRRQQRAMERVFFYLRHREKVSLTVMAYKTAVRPCPSQPVK